MKRWHNIFGQSAALLTHVVNYWTPLVPEPKKPYVFAAVGTAQAVLGILAHAYNPDGTKAEVAYDPKAVIDVTEPKK